MNNNKMKETIDPIEIDYIETETTKEITITKQGLKTLKTIKNLLIILIILIFIKL